MATTTRKATHEGHCQVCGAQQKLPGGMLAKHGYTVEWGWFNGVCYGSGHLPYQQDCSLVVQSRDAAVAQAAAVRGRADEAESEAKTSSTVWFHAYFEARGRSRGRYEWVSLPVAVDAYGRPIVMHDTRGGDKPTAYVLPHDLRHDDRVRAAVEYGAAKYAKDLRKIADQIDAYARRQTARIESWQPADLLPVE